MSKLSPHYQNARLISQFLDQEFKIGSFRFGLDPIMGLIPGIGDVIPFLLGTYIVWVGMQAKLPQEAISRMVANLVIDLVIGAIPIAGDIGDFFFRANKRNMEILEQFIVKE
ncbi:MAG TPA: DUF4112 domain-containing protein [Patescibacteria group bacterium]